MKSDTGIMTTIVALGAFTIGYAVAKIASAQSAMPAAGGTQGLGAAIAWQRANTLRGWGTPGFTGMGQTGAVRYFRRVS
jgi:hypothetical protein